MEAFVVMRLIFVLAALHGLAFIDRTMIGGVLPLLRESVAMTDAQAGWIVGTAFALPYGAAALAVAALRRRRRASNAWLCAGVALWTLGSIATGLAGSLGALTGARALLGIGQGIFVPMAIARLLDGTAPAVRGRALGLFIGGSTIGRSIALLTVGTLLSLLALLPAGPGIAPWRSLFVVTALPNVLVLIALAIGPAPAPDPSDDAPPAATHWRALLRFFPVAVAPVVLAQAVLGWLPTLFVRERGLAAPDAALVIGVITIFAAPAGPIIAGWLIGRHKVWEDHVPALILLALAVTLVPLAGMVWAPGPAGAVASLVAMLVTLGMASFGGLFGVQLLIPPDARVGVNGVYLAFVTIVGVGLGPLMTGALASVTKGSGASLGHALFVTGVITVVVCALAVAGVGRRYRQGMQP